MNQVFGFMQALDEETRVGALFDGINNVLDGIDEGLFDMNDANRILEDMARKLGFDIDDAFDLVVYIQFRRTGTPPITIH